MTVEQMVAVMREHGIGRMRVGDMEIDLTHRLVAVPAPMPDNSGMLTKDGLPVLETIATGDPKTPVEFCACSHHIAEHNDAGLCMSGSACDPSLCARTPGAERIGA